MRIGKPHETRFSRNVEIYLSDSSFSSVTIHQSVDVADMKWGKADINWSAFGPQPIEVVTEFEKALQSAIEIAVQWTTEKYGHSIQMEQS